MGKCTFGELKNNNLDEYDDKDQFSKIECMFFRLHKYSEQEQTVYLC